MTHGTTSDRDHEVASAERGAVGTEMAIVVAIVVAIAVALGAVMLNSAEAHQDCIPTTPGEDVTCDFSDG